MTGNASDFVAGLLQDWAAGAFGAGAQVRALKRLSGGASKESWSLDLARGDDAPSPLILRRSPPQQAAAAAGHESEALPLATEAALIRQARLAGLPVPDIVHVFEETAELGQAFLMSREAGIALPRPIQRDAAYAKARGRLAAECGRAMAKLHAAPLPEGLEHSPALEQLARYKALRKELSPAGHPVFVLAEQVLEGRAPEPVGPVWVHGDFRLGNLLLTETGLNAVLDWELSHLGDPREDLSWGCINSWRFGGDGRFAGLSPAADLLRAYREAGGRDFAEDELDWFELLGSYKWGVMCMMMLASHTSGAAPSIERVAIGRRISETEADMLVLLHRMRDAT